MSAQDLDDMAKAILEAIYQNGGSADTSEIKQYTGFDDNSKLHYRRNNHLEPKGFIECETRDTEDTLNVTVWSLTEKGEKAVDRNMTEQDTPPIADQFEELREIVSHVRRDMDAVNGRMDEVNREVEDALNRIDVKLDGLDRRLERIDEGLDRIDEFEERLEEVEDQPFEEIANDKIQTMQGILSEVKHFDALNRDMRKILKRNGYLKATRKPLHAKDAPHLTPEDVEKMKSDRAPGNEPVRDGYEAGPKLQ
jgi:DNA-binding PadR family transcriptional regulator